MKVILYFFIVFFFSCINVYSTDIITVDNNISYLHKQKFDTLKTENDKIIITMPEVKNEPWYLKYLLPSILTLIVALISFWLTQLYFRNQNNKNMLNEYCDLLQYISSEVKRNLDLECQIHAYLFSGLLPTFRLTFFGLDIFKELARVSLNNGLLNDIYQGYFYFQHIQDRIDLTFKKDEIFFELSTTLPKEANEVKKAKKRYDSVKSGTEELIRGNVKESFELYNSILKELKKFKPNTNLILLSEEYLEKKYIEYQKDRVVLEAAKMHGIDIRNRPRFVD